MTVKIGLTISGAISLGAYEGGALAALLVAAEQLRDHVEIDVIAGASAGAMTGLVTARCLALGADPVESMKQAWVDLPDIDRLATHTEDSPLSARRLTEAAIAILGDKGPAANPANRQHGDVRLTMAMCSLAGLGYRIRVTPESDPVDAVTYVEWSDATFGPESTVDSFLQVASRALASGANPIGFPPKRIAHTTEELKRLGDDGVGNLENLATSWYTDGGTLDNEPFGRLLDVISDAHDTDGHRVLLLVHPVPTRRPEASDWTNPALQPRWPRTGLRAKALQGDQSIYDDLRSLAKTNTRLAWVDKVVDALDAAFEAVGAGEGTAESAQVRAALVAAINELESEHAELNETLARKPSSRTDVAGVGDTKDLLKAAIHRATGLSGKRRAVVEIVSPELDPSGLPPGDLLAGEKLGHFFGFMDVRFRQSDFALGYRNMQIWLESRLDSYLAAEVGPDERKAVWHAVNERYVELGWQNVSWGKADMDTLSLAQKWRLASVGAHIVHITERDVRHWSDGIPVGPEEVAP